MAVLELSLIFFKFYFIFKLYNIDFFFKKRILEIAIKIKQKFLQSFRMFIGIHFCFKNGISISRTFLKCVSFFIC